MQEKVSQRHVATLAALALLLAAIAAGCGSSSDTKSDSASDSAASGGATQSSSEPVSTIDAALDEWSITTNSQTAKSGKVTLKATNDGQAPHEVVVLKTDQPADSLKVTDGRVSEQDSVGEVSELAAGESGSKTLDLKPGKYVLVCNISGHYPQGMYTSLTVK